MPNSPSLVCLEISFPPAFTQATDAGLANATLSAVDIPEGEQATVESAMAQKVAIWDISMSINRRVFIF